MTETVRKILALTQPSTEQVVSELVSLMKSTFSDTSELTPEFEKAIEGPYAEALKANADIRLAPVADTYAKHFTSEEMNEIVSLFESPLFRKMNTVAPEIQPAIAEGRDALMNAALATVPAIQEFLYERTIAFAEKNTGFPVEGPAQPAAEWPSSAA